MIDHEVRGCKEVLNEDQVGIWNWGVNENIYFEGARDKEVGDEDWRGLGEGTKQEKVAEIGPATEREGRDAVESERRVVLPEEIREGLSEANLRDMEMETVGDEAVMVLTKLDDRKGEGIQEGGSNIGQL